MRLYANAFKDVTRTGPGGDPSKAPLTAVVGVWTALAGRRRDRPAGGPLVVQRRAAAPHNTRHRRVPTVADLTRVFSDHLRTAVTEIISGPQCQESVYGSCLLLETAVYENEPFRFPKLWVHTH